MFCHGVEKHDTAATRPSWWPSPKWSSSVQTILDMFIESSRNLGLPPPCSVGEALTYTMRFGNDLSETKGLQQNLSQENMVLVRKWHVLQADMDKVRKAKEEVSEKLSVARRDIKDNARRATNNSAKALEVPVSEMALNKEKKKKGNLQRMVSSARETYVGRMNNMNLTLRSHEVFNNNIRRVIKKALQTSFNSVRMGRIWIRRRQRRLMLPWPRRGRL